MSALPVFVDEANALQVDVNAKSAAAASSATLASTKASDAAAARDIVMAAVNYKGVWSSLSGALSIPASVLHNGAIWMLSQNVATVQSVTPGVSTVWLNVTPASGLGTAAYQNSGAFQAAFGTLAGIVKANGAGSVSAATTADILALIGTNSVQNASAAGTAGTASVANAIVDGAVSSTYKLADRVVTWGKIAAMTTGKLLGRTTAGGGDVEEISIGANLTLSGGVLSANVPAALTNAQVAAAATAGYGYTPAPDSAYVAATVYNMATGAYTGYGTLRLTRANATFSDIVISSYDNTPPSSGSCLHPHSVIATPSGSIFICDIRPGDLVLTPSGFKTVLGSWESSLGSRQLVSINNGPVVTPGHLFPLASGEWAAVDPGEYEQHDKGKLHPVKTLSGMRVIEANTYDATSLKVGDMIVTEAGATPVYSIEFYEVKATCLPVFSLVLDGAAEFFADGISVSTL